MMARIIIPNSYEIYIVYRAAQVSYSRRHLFLSQVLSRLHCIENPIYVFLFWELRGLSPNFHIHVSVSDNSTRVHKITNVPLLKKLWDIIFFLTITL
jgi:hypothetical protein